MLGSGKGRAILIWGWVIVTGRGEVSTSYSVLSFFINLLTALILVFFSLIISLMHSILDFPSTGSITYTPFSGTLELSSICRSLSLSTSFRLELTWERLYSSTISPSYYCERRKSGFNWGVWDKWLSNCTYLSFPNLLNWDDLF